MKRHLITALAACLTLAVLAGSLQAKDAKGRKDRKGGPEGAKRMRRGPGGPRKMPDIGLTDDQKAQIEGIRKDAMAAMKDAKGEEKRDIFKKMREDIQKVFTEDQLAKMKKLREDGPKRGGRPDLGLSDEQKEKMAAIRKATAAKMKDAKPEERKGIMEDARKQMEAVLTDEQLEKMKEFRKGGGQRPHRGMPDIGLTDDQKAEMKKIRETAMAKMKDAKGEEKRDIMQQMHKDMRALMTEEQLDKLEAARKDRGPKRGGDKDKPEPRGKGRKPRGPRGGGKKRPDAE